jgi:hypothetical protein
VTDDAQEWWEGQVVAHVSDDMTLIRVGKHRDSASRLDTEFTFQTELIPIDCRALGCHLLVSWWKHDLSNPGSSYAAWAVKRFPEIPN